MSYAIVRIKEGSRCTQDLAAYTWPPSQCVDGKELAGVDDDCIFVARKIVTRSGALWDCEAPGAGQEGDYGNGGICADSVEMLSPLLGFKPDREYVVSLIDDIKTST